MLCCRTDKDPAKIVPPTQACYDHSSIQERHCYGDRVVIFLGFVSRKRPFRNKLTRHVSCRTLRSERRVVVKNNVIDGLALLRACDGSCEVKTFAELYKKNDSTGNKERSFRR